MDRWIPKQLRGKKSKREAMMDQEMDALKRQVSALTKQFQEFQVKQVATEEHRSLPLPPLQGNEIDDYSEEEKFVGRDDNGRLAIVVSRSMGILMGDGLQVAEKVHLHFPKAAGEKYVEGMVVGPYVCCATGSAFLVVLDKEIDCPSLSMLRRPAEAVNDMPCQHVLLTCTGDTVTVAQGMMKSGMITGFESTNRINMKWAYLGQTTAKPEGAVFIDKKLYGVATAIDPSTYWVWDVTEVPNAAPGMMRLNVEKIEAAGYSGCLPLHPPPPTVLIQYI